jgi:very-short-patch-repair endonuclease
LAPKAGLIVEVDGPYHLRRRAADAARERSGFRVLRFSEEQVLQNLPAVVARIRLEVFP